MENGIIKYKGSHCFNCNSDMIMCYDIKNRPVSFAIRDNTTLSDILESLNDTTISYMKCRSCGKVYMVDYSLGFARPIPVEHVRSLFFGVE